MAGNDAEKKARVDIEMKAGEAVLVKITELHNSLTGEERTAHLGDDYDHAIAMGILNTLTIVSERLKMPVPLILATVYCKEITHQFSLIFEAGLYRGLELKTREKEKDAS